MSQNKEKSYYAAIKQSVDKCVPYCDPPAGIRTIKFPDGTKCSLNGLDEILAGIYSEGRKVTGRTAGEIINRLEANKNYIPSSEKIRREYSIVLLREYANYIKTQRKKK